MNTIRILRVVVLYLSLAGVAVSCTTYDYDAELNDNEQQRIRLHQEDQKIYDEITVAAQSLDHLVGEMSARVRDELAAKEQSLLQAITESEDVLNQYLTDKLGDADAYVDNLERQSRQLLHDKEDEFNQACAILQQEKITLADQGYDANVQKMQEGIDLINNFQAQYDDAIGTMRDRLAALQQMQQRLSALETLIAQNQAKRDQILQRVSQLQSRMQQSIQAAITSTKTSEEHTAALRELQASYSELVTAMKQLEQAYTYDDSWVNEAENYVQLVQGAIPEIENAISQTNELNALLGEFEAGKAEDILNDLTDLRDKMQDLADYDTSALDEAQTAADELQDVCDSILSNLAACDDALARAEAAYEDCDWESWKS